MAIKVFIKRRCKEVDLIEVNKLLIKARSIAMKYAGYISSETLYKHNDERSVLVVSMWQNIDQWENYKTSEERKAHETEFETLLDAPTEYEIYDLGLPIE